MHALPYPEDAVANGLFSTAQARALGYSPVAIRREIDRGRWVRLERGILSAAGRTEQASDPALLAVLRCGPRALVSHETAAEARGWELARRPALLHVIVPHDSSRAPRQVGVTVHRGAAAADVVNRILPATDPCRTALDVAGTLMFDEAVVAVDSALRSRLVTLDELGRELRRRGSWNRAAKARAALAAASALSGSVPETQARLLFAKAGLSRPIEQWEVRIDCRVIRADFAWLAERVIVEIDGYAFHSSFEAFQPDRTRQNSLVLDGWTVLRFTPLDVTMRPDVVAATIRAALAAV